MPDIIFTAGDGRAMDRKSMNKAVKRLVHEIDQLQKCLTMNFDNPFWRKDIPSAPCWYLIKTNTPVEALKAVGPPKYKAHINFPETIAATSRLQDAGMAILPCADDEDYVVYNGEAKNLKARAREHENGHAKTYCLGLANYKSLHKYRWTFCHLPLSSCTALTVKIQDNKLLRLAGEQGWRGYNGWPILCKY